MRFLSRGTYEKKPKRNICSEKEVETKFECQICLFARKVVNTITSCYIYFNATTVFAIQNNFILRGALLWEKF